MSTSDLNLPQPLLELDERLLPQACREDVAHMVGLGYRREHMLIGTDFKVYISPELAFMYPLDGDEDEDG